MGAYDYFSSPVESSAQFERVDQGVDYKGKPGTYIHALGSGRLYSIGGQWNTIYEELDAAVTIGGRTYRQVYYGESNPIAGIRVGQHVNQGQPLAQYTDANPWSEIGFAQGTSWGPLIGGLGDATKAGQRGVDFAALIDQLGAPGIPEDLGSLPNIAPGVRVPDHGHQGVNAIPGAGQTIGAVKTAAGAVGSATDLIGKVIGFVFSLRFLEVAGGGVLVVLALQRMLKGAGISLPTPPPAAVAAAAVV